MSSAPHIFTLTANLLSERTLVFDRWSPGKTHRAKAETYQVGGKGINVAKMLNRLGAPNTALLFAGTGGLGRACEAWLREKNFTFQNFPTTASTRAGTVIRDLSGAHPETTFLGPDTPPDAAAIRACVEFLAAQPTGSVLAICGSMPGWESPDFEPLRELLHRWPERGALIADTYGPPLAWFVNEGTTFVRVNRRELQTLCSPDDQNLSSGELLLKLRDRNRALRWAVTDGPGPVWYLGETGDPEMLATPAIREVSPTGSGDVMLACILFARFHRGLSWRDAVAWSLPYAAANAAHSGIAEFALPAS